MRVSERIHIGTSGWHYAHWRGPFYPESMAARDMLAFYGGRFRTVEINNSFYQLPKTETLEQWRADSPDGFIFSVKASRYITHMKKLKDPVATLPQLLERVRLLREKLGPVLFQLPPGWKFDEKRFDAFVAALPAKYRYTFEFRDASWLNDRAYEILKQNDIAFCIYELAGFTSPKEVTAGFIYVRLHGPGNAYQGDYERETLAGWAESFLEWAGRGKEIFCYFDNDQAGYAALNAMKLRQMIDES
jgi:uncharacterized protein YecE (DUF72 family)